MKSITFDNSSQILITTVSLSINKENPTSVWLFRCYHCGTPMVELRGKVASIFTGFLPNFEPLLIDQCYKCKEYFTYQHKAKEIEVTRLILPMPYPGQTDHFLCILCRSSLLEYGNGLVQLLPNRILLDPPASFTCWKPDCRRKYLLEDVCSVI